MYELASGGHAVQSHRELSTFASGEAKEPQAPDRQMEPQEIQSGLPDQSTYFDPEAPDVSEQQFSASLDAVDPKPSFVLDDPEIKPDLQQAASLPAPADEQPLQPLETGESTLDGQDASPPTMGDDWRDQVSAKVNHYKSRKTPKVRYPSLQLQFEPPPARVRASLELEADFSNTLSQVEIPQSRQTPETPVSLEATARVIEFPRPAAPPPRLDELAEPLLDRPRILEAPALVPPPPALGGIRIEAANEETPERRPGFDMPLSSATLRRKLLAAGIDGLFVGAALAIFGYALFRFNGLLQPGKLMFQVAAVVLAMLWSAYQYAFLVYTGSTPGIRICRLALTRFDGGAVSRSGRRWRVLASFLSCISLGLGYVWCFFDEDQLSWHDRITKTHLAPVSTPDQM